MIIVADGGSTKTNWCLINEDGNKIHFNTEGYNPFFVDTSYIISSLKKALPSDLPLEQITEVNYYGAGVHGESKAGIVSQAISSVFTGASVFVGHDLLAAARALLAHQPGFVAILGTGTNSCIYDGKVITHHIDSAAYILGDEGSGCHMGKKILTDYVRGYMPLEVREKFWEIYGLTPDEVMDAVYSKPLANRFCASFSKFVYDNTVNVEYSKAIVQSAFEDFFRNLVSNYPGYRDYSFNCIGSVAYTFRNILEDTVKKYGMEMGQIIRSPIDDLVKFHLGAAQAS
ncbi:N-acetylglucosamine kinase [Parapedobacter pyrenivorans]|nr:N-acetylglucosamine kinase [Parapedobacter pyrenivorans]